MPFYSENPDAPDFLSLLWDNFKTTVMEGGRATGIFTGFVGGATGGILGCGYGKSSESASIGYAITGAFAGIPGAITGIFLSPFFTFSAMLTRDFKRNDEINGDVARILSFDGNEHYQRYIINQIIKEYNDLEWWRVISSYESRTLMRRLTDASSLQEKWKALKNYLKENDSSSINTYYDNNGTKTFNVILSVSKKLDLKKQLLDALDNRDDATVTRLIHHHPELLTEKISHNKNLFQLLVLDNSVEAVRLLLRIDTFPRKMLDEAVGYNSTLLYQAVKNGYEDMANILLRAGADGGNKHDTCGEDYKHVIHLAAAKGLTSVVKTILSLSPSETKLINYPDINNDNMTPLHHAVKNGQEEMVRYLVAKGADVNWLSDTQKTALQLADEKNNKTIADCLLEQGKAWDCDYAQFKKHLSILFDIIHHDGWEKQGYEFKFFDESICVPKGVQWLRDNFPSRDILEDRYQVLALAKQFKNHDFGSSISRKDDTKILFQLVKSIDRNHAHSYQELDAYKPGEDEHQREKQYQPSLAVY